MGGAGSVGEIRTSSRHFRIVFPGCSERAISPAIFSRSGNCMGERESERYISVSKRLSAYADIESQGSKPQTEPLSLCRSAGKGRRRIRLPRTTSLAQHL